MLADYVFGSWQVEAAVRLVFAALLGAVIGLEREHHGRAAGLRTHLLVTLGAAMAMLVSLHFEHVFGLAGEESSVSIDPARVAYGVMGGIGFLGAGAIIRYGIGVRGLTTAASLWCAAAIGLGAGFGMYEIAAVATAIVLFALIVLHFADRLIRGRATKTITLTAPGTSFEAVQKFEDLLRKGGANVVNVDHTRDFKNDLTVVSMNITIPTPRLQTALESLHEGAPEITKMIVE